MRFEMSKRFIFQQHGERKKAKLDITISDHNFPLSQNAGSSKESDIAQPQSWGDDNDDEILLLASQACEDAYNDFSTLPDYSMCMQPSSTSTQAFNAGPSTSKTPFTFKKPSMFPPNLISTNLKDKCNRISSPLPGMSAKVASKHDEHVNITDDLIFNDKIYKGQNSDYVYRQLLQLQEENAKLKSENGKLLEKCVTKEGEASILRTQLKSCQVSVDNARMERIKAQEKVQMEWTEKLSAANKQMHDLRTQLDFKNLEIISVKEKCKMLESNKIRLTQVTVPNNDILSSYRNTGINVANDSITAQSKRVKQVSNGVQTDDKSRLLYLHITIKPEKHRLTEILPLLLEPTSEQRSLLEYNEKLQKHNDLSQNKCRVYSTFHRVPASPIRMDKGKNKVAVNDIYENLMSIIAGKGLLENYLNVLRLIRTVLSEVVSQLELVSQKMTTSFQREMDERYIEATTEYILVEENDLISGRYLYKDEQGILARRMAAILTAVVKTTHGLKMMQYFDELNSNDGKQNSNFIEILLRICSLLDTTCCALVYSGLLLSITHLVESLIGTYDCVKLWEITHTMISSRPMPFVACRLLSLVRKLSVLDGFVDKFCPGNNLGNLKLDYDQGVLLYKKDSCDLQIMLKQVEAALKCIDTQVQSQPAADVTRDLIALHTNLNWGSNVLNQDRKCDCHLVLMQVIVYALRICAVMAKNYMDSTESNQLVISEELLSLCRGGLQALCVRAREELGATAEGHLVHFAELMKIWRHSDLYENMLMELTSTFQSAPEDTSSYHRQSWVKSFENFSMED